MAARKLLKVLDGERVGPPPIWMMRQAGRYLPEYRAVREQAGGFLDLCYDVDKATEVTLQPIRRFGFDAAILFSDILTIPDALDRGLHFVTGEGPKLTPIRPDEIDRLDPERAETHLAPVIATLGRLRGELPDETTLIGFCGAPWTVATYMIAGEGTPDQGPARRFAYEHPAEFERLIYLLAEMGARYLVRQLQAGADCVQIFDTWAGILDEAAFDAYAVAPVAHMVATVRAAIPDARIIAFPKGAGSRLERYRERTRVTALGLDWQVPMDQARALQAGGPVQGNLDPMRLIVGGQPLLDGVDRILDALGDGPLIFNLGHGITPQTPIAHVEAMLARIRERN